jgi:DnaJ-class molecular chaperone
MARDFYSVLGVGRGESSSGLRLAFHERARERHESHDEAGLRAVSEAYAALSSPGRPRAHDRGLRLGEARDAWAHSARPGDWHPSPSRMRGFALLDDEASVRPSFEALRDRVLRNFTGRGVPKSEHVEALNLELLLTPDEASRARPVRLRVPSLHTCASCGGSGSYWGAPCPGCDEAGIVHEDETVAVALPARGEDGASCETSLAGLGIRNLVLRVHVAVIGG